MRGRRVEIQVLAAAAPVFAVLACALPLRAAPQEGHREAGGPDPDRSGALPAIARHESLFPARALSVTPAIIPHEVELPAVAGPPPAPPAWPLDERDPGLQAGLLRVLAEPGFRRHVRDDGLSVALVDVTDPERIRYAGADDDHMRYAASLPKIGILLGVFQQVADGALPYTPALRADLEAMIRRSDNRLSTALIERVGFREIEKALCAPGRLLYDASYNGGIWVGRDYGGGRGLWKRDPLHGVSHGATARQVARFLVMLDEGDLVSPWASAEMKRILGEPEIHHKFVRGLESRPSRIFRKSGTWKQWHADAAIVERAGRKYVAVALLEGAGGGKVLSDLILRLDDLVMGSHPGDEAGPRSGGAPPAAGR
ncbi:MAG: serine hydrolase [Gemmatimonadota bacterium]|nr:serine hydrolase [Gemmatimonadota bacterium]